ncbi:hypothetical protein [Brevundimonas sp.]|uniref:hypothetical protein n=1 Tax=Brevundimonas sp. TaxID=1871086 RepID=UPI002ED9A6D9
MIDDIYAQAVLAVAVLTVAFAFWKGDEPERLGAAAYAMAFLATSMIRGDATPNVPRWGMMGIEIVLLVVFIGLALHSRRAWPVWAASFQALVVTNHVLIAASLRPPVVAAATVINMSNYGLLVALAVGTFWAWQERRAAAMSSTGRL